jgi:hypothetical protein
MHEALFVAVQNLIDTGSRFGTLHLMNAGDGKFSYKIKSLHTVLRIRDMVLCTPWIQDPDPV